MHRENPPGHEEIEIHEHLKYWVCHLKKAGNWRQLLSSPPLGRRGCRSGFHPVRSAPAQAASPAPDVAPTGGSAMLGSLRPICKQTLGRWRPGLRCRGSIRRHQAVCLLPSTAAPPSLATREGQSCGSPEMRL